MWSWVTGVTLVLGQSKNHILRPGALPLCRCVWIIKIFGFGVVLDCSQSLFYYVPQESHGQAGRLGCPKIIHIQSRSLGSSTNRGSVLYKDKGGPIWWAGSYVTCVSTDQNHPLSVASNSIILKSNVTRYQRSIQVQVGQFKSFRI